MILIDTVVVSELRRIASGRINPAVAAWNVSIGSTPVFLSAITILELRTGVLLKERKDPVQGRTLSRWLERQLLPLFADAILPVDTAVTFACASLHCRSHAHGTMR